MLGFALLLSIFLKSFLWKDFGDISSFPWYGGKIQFFSDLVIIF